MLEPHETGHSGGSKEWPGWAMSLRFLAGPLLGSPSFVLNFMFKSVWFI